MTKRRIIIGNVDCEAQCGEPEKRDSTERAQSSRVAHRLVWLAKGGDVLFMPYPVSNNILTYVNQLVDFGDDPVCQFAAANLNEDAVLLTASYLAEAALVERVGTALAKDMFEAIAYFPDVGLLSLAQRTNVNLAPEMENFLKGGNSIRFNRKSTFRDLAKTLNVPTAPGRIVSNAIELAKAASTLLDETGSIIVKADLAGGGEGNIVVTLDPNRNSSLGAQATWRVASIEEACLRMPQLWQMLSGANNSQLVVESYFDASSVFYAELEVKAGGQVVLLNDGLMRMEPTWVGFEIPLNLPKEKNTTAFRDGAVALAEAVAATGYIGLMNVDGLLTTKDQLLFTEINVRLGGCTHVHVAAERLAGASYQEDRVLFTRNLVPFRGSFNSLVRLLESIGLSFSKDKRLGVVILAEDLGRTGTFEYMIVAESRDTAQSMEARLKVALEGTI